MAKTEEEKQAAREQREEAKRQREAEREERKAAEEQAQEDERQEDHEQQGIAPGEQPGEDADEQESYTPDHAPEEQVSGDQVDAEGQPRAARDGESVSGFAIEAKEERVNAETGGLTSAEEQERAAAQAYPRRNAAPTFDPAEDEVEPARVGHAATSRSEIGRVIVVDEDCEHEGEVYKAGTQQQPLEVADALIDEGLAYEPAGKKRGR